TGPLLLLGLGLRFVLVARLDLLERFLDPLPASRTVVEILGQLVTPSVVAKELVLGTVAVFDVSEVLLSKLAQSLLATISLQRGIPRDLRSVQRHHAQLHHAQLGGKFQSLGE